MTFKTILIGLPLAVLGLALSGSATAGVGPDPPPISKPPPRRPPPPPAHVQPPPPAPQPVAPQPVAPQPVAAAPSAAEIAAAHRAAAARARAAKRAKAARAHARAVRLRAKRARAAREAARDTPAAAGVQRARGPDNLSGPSAPDGALPVVIAALLAAGLLLGFALVPARAVPWYWAERALEDHRGELALFGALGLFAAGFFLFVSRAG